MKINIGDCFELKINDTLYVYFQYIDNDEPQLNSDCIGFFRKTSDTQFAENNFSEIYNSGIQFYSHTYVSGMHKFYKRVADALPILGNKEDIIFSSEIKLQGITPISIFRIRKLGQDIESSNVDEETYRKYKQYTWKDGVTGPYGYREDFLRFQDNSNY